jgi:hypothetical protein
MSLVEQTADQPTMTIAAAWIVSDAADQEIRSFRAAIGQAGVPFESVPDVYAATAKLARGDWSGKIFVDVRTLDDKEMAFLRLVPRFFPRCEVIVPAFDGTGDRPALRAAGLNPLVVSAALDAAIYGCGKLPLSRNDEQSAPEPPIAEIPEAPLQQDAMEEEPEAAPGIMEEDERIAPLVEAENTPLSDEPATAAPILASPGDDAPEGTPEDAMVEPPPVLRLSTDGGPEAAGTRPALHEVVRMRMAAEERRPVRRPPPRTPPGAAPAGTPPATPPPVTEGTPPRGLNPMLSPDEMDALLRDDDLDAGETSLPEEPDGGAK